MLRINVPENTSIVVYANYRTGSTALCDMLAKEFNLKNYDELFHPLGLHKINLDIIQHPCIFKIMPDHEIPHSIKSLVDNSYKIGITRRSVVQQIASFYISTRTGKWHYEKKELTKNIKNYNVTLNQDALENEVRYILKM